MLVIFKALKQYKSFNILWRGRFADRVIWHPPPIQKGGISTGTWMNLVLNLFRTQCERDRHNKSRQHARINFVCFHIVLWVAIHTGRSLEKSSSEKVPSQEMGEFSLSFSYPIPLFKIIPSQTLNRLEAHNMQICRGEECGYSVTWGEGIKKGKWHWPVEKEKKDWES